MARAPGVMLLVLVLQLALLLETQFMWAQVEVGARVRVTAHSIPGRRIGSLVSLDGDSLRYTRWDTSSVVAVPLESVARLERSIGRRSNTGRGATLGALIGGGFGLFLGIAASTDNSGWWEVGPEEIAAATAVAGVAGAGLGAVIGSLSKRDRWEPVTLTPRVARNPRQSKTITRLTLRF